MAIRAAACIWVLSLIGHIRDWRMPVLALLVVVSSIYYGMQEWRWMQSRADGAGVAGADVVDVLGVALSFLILVGVYLLAQLMREREQALHSAVKAGEELEELFQQASDGIFTLDAEGNFSDVNEVGLKITGYSRKDLLGKSLIELVPLAEIPSIIIRLEDVLHGEKALFQFNLTRADGSERPVEMSVRQISDGRVVGIVRDISFREAIRPLEIKPDPVFHSVAQRASGVAYVCRNDERYRMHYIGDGVAELTGYTKDEFLNDSVSFVELFHPDDTMSIFREVEQALKERRPFLLSYRIRRKDGETRWIYEIGVGVFQGDELRFLEGFLSDITEQKAALHPSETPCLSKNLQPDAIWVINGEGETAFASQRLFSLLGEDEGKMLGAAASRFLVNEHGAPEEALECLAQAPENQPFLMLLRHASGRVVRVRACAQRIQDVAGASCGAVLVISELEGDDGDLPFEPDPVISG
ncbi:MAG: PAS domain S-box protein [Bdellovibrionales bacterium]|nr:PAS domain S-box protein [Bdellovibrionales bacterium]